MFGDILSFIFLGGEVNCDIPPFVRLGNEACGDISFLTFVFLGGGVCDDVVFSSFV